MCHVSPEPNSGCWLWDGSLSTSGYASTGVYRSDRNQAVTTHAHIVLYEILVGPVPHGLELDHVCRQRSCVNPRHLEPVTHQVNVLRGAAPTADNARRSVCVNGHPLTPDNLVTSMMDRGRFCRTCHNARVMRYTRNRRATDPEYVERGRANAREYLRKRREQAKAIGDERLT